MAEKNFLPLNRSLLNHWLWKDKPFSKGQAWVDLLLLANYEDKKMPYKGEVVTCKRGDVNISITELAKRWGWSRNSARRFLMLLESDGMVTVNATTHRTTITLEKYGFFNNPCATNEATSGRQVDDKWATSGQQVDTTKKVKNVKKVKKVENNIHTASAVRIDYQHYVDLYNLHCSSLPQVKTLNEKRKRLIKRVVKEVSEDDLLTALNKANTNSFLRGDSGGWKANFDWLMNPDNITKVLEGNYDRGKTQNSTNKDYDTDFGVVIEV